MAPRPKLGSLAKGNFGGLAGAFALGAGAAAWLADRRKQTSVAPVPVAPGPPAPSPSAHGALLMSGAPGPVADVLQHEAYVTAYDRRLRHPHWTAEHITAESIKRKPGADGPHRSQSVFTEDQRIPEPFRAHNSDYFQSGYDRGHMVPAADAKTSQRAMDETFLLSNIAPQVGPGMNRDYWAHTEDFVRRLTQQFQDVYVFTVPLYLPRQSTDGRWRVTYEVIGRPPSIAVPTHFAKVILGVGRGPNASLSLSSLGLGQNMALGAFVIPNSMVPDETPLRKFEADVAQVEHASGLTLFPDAIKKSASKLCSSVRCEIIIRDFSNANKQAARGLPAPAQGKPSPVPGAAPPPAPAHAQPTPAPGAAPAPTPATPAGPAPEQRPPTAAWSSPAQERTSPMP